MIITDKPTLLLIKKALTAYLVCCESENRSQNFLLSYVSTLFFNSQKEEVYRLRDEIDKHLKDWPGNAGERPDPMPEANG